VAATVAVMTLACGEDDDDHGDQCGQETHAAFFLVQEKPDCVSKNENSNMATML
jgi:hypothetical protein